MSPPAGGPLADLRVIETGQLLAGPFCGQLLGDFGAEVIKLEDPARGDPMRAVGPGEAARQVAVVAGGRPQQEVGHLQPARRRTARTCVRELVATADVLVENFRPGTLERWGLGCRTSCAGSTRG